MPSLADHQDAEDITRLLPECCILSQLRHCWLTLSVRLDDSLKEEQMEAARPHWPMFSEVLRRQALMDDMMERCGIDMVDLIRRDNGQSFAEARAKCRSCMSEMDCRAWLLTSGTIAAASPPEFCPNAALLRGCLEDTAEVRMRELAALVSKLRWIGMEEEAVRLQKQTDQIRRRQNIRFGNFLEPYSETD